MVTKYNKLSKARTVIVKSKYKMVKIFSLKKKKKKRNICNILPTMSDLVHFSNAHFFAYLIKKLIIAKFETV